MMAPPEAGTVRFVELDEIRNQVECEDALECDMRVGFVGPQRAQAHCRGAGSPDRMAARLSVLC